MKQTKKSGTSDLVETILAATVGGTIGGVIQPQTLAQATILAIALISITVALGEQYEYVAAHIIYKIKDKIKMR